MKVSSAEKNTVKNTMMLYVMAFVKLILPLVTLPYLTRALTKETYGVVTYTRACMTYIQLIIDFGFILSSVKDIVHAQGDKEKIGFITGHTFLAKTFLIAVSFVAMLIMCFSIRILRNNVAFALLSFAGTATTAYLADFLFRGLEKMHIVTIIFLITKSVSTALTFLLIRGDNQVLLIPVLDIVANLLATLLSFIWVYRLGIKIRINSLRMTFWMVKDSFSYFISSMATTVFSVLNTILIGVVITDLEQIAYWGLCIQIVSAIQGLYAPLTNGVYPHMLREKSLRFVHKVLALIMPVVTVGCVASFLLSKTALLVVGGKEYVEAYRLFRCLIPVLFFSFPAQLYGWPTLGAIGLVKQTTISTIAAAIVQVLGLVLLIATNTMTLYSVAILKCLVELFLMVMRMAFTYRNRKEFARGI